MKVKEIGQRLDVFECIQLLDKAVEYGLYKRDKKNEDNIKIYRQGIGWCSAPITDCAYELSFDLNGQTYIRKNLALLGVEFNSFLEFQKAVYVMG